VLPPDAPRLVWRAHNVTTASLSVVALGSSRETAGYGVQKVLRAGAPGRPLRGVLSPSHWNFWKREALFYQSPLPALLPPQLRAPRLLSCEERDTGELSLLLEFVANDPAPWSAEHFCEVSFWLGAWQADTQPKGDWPTWLSVEALRQRISPPYTERQISLLDLLDAAPRVLCHLDCWPANLLRVETGFVLVDWSSVGWGAAGQDLASLLFDAVWMGILSPAEVETLVAPVCAAYAEGFFSRGGRFSPQETQRAVLAVGGLQFLPLTAWLELLPERPQRQANLETRLGLPWREVYEARRALLDWLGRRVASL
jgi:hypothetical protein